MPVISLSASPTDDISILILAPSSDEDTKLRFVFASVIQENEKTAEVQVQFLGEHNFFFFTVEVPALLWFTVLRPVY